MPQKNLPDLSEYEQFEFRDMLLFKMPDLGTPKNACTSCVTEPLTELCKVLPSCSGDSGKGFVFVPLKKVKAHLVLLVAEKLSQ